MSVGTKILYKEIISLIEKFPQPKEHPLFYQLKSIADRVLWAENIDPNHLEIVEAAKIALDNLPEYFEDDTAISGCDIHTTPYKQILSYGCVSVARFAYWNFETNELQFDNDFTLQTDNYGDELWDVAEAIRYIQQTIQELDNG